MKMEVNKCTVYYFFIYFEDMYILPTINCELIKIPKLNDVEILFF